MTNEQLALFLELIADKIETELMHDVEVLIDDGPREVEVKYEWIGEGEEPKGLNTVFIMKATSPGKWKKIEKPGEFLALAQIQEFADGIRNMKESLND